MMKKGKPGALYFTGLTILSKARVAFTGHYYDLEDSDDRRTAVPEIRNGGWVAYDDLSGIVYAIRSARTRKWRFFLLERNRGLYRLADADNVSFERIDEARDGFLTDLRHIGKHWYAVGGHHQIYREENLGWTPFDNGVYVPGERGETLILNSIDGTAENDIYTTGFNGVILHYDGTNWAALDSPTNVGFQRVLCLSREEVYLCGNANALYRGHRDQWHPLTQLDDAIVYWDMAYFQGKVYVCTKKKLFVIDGDELVEVDIPLKGPLAFYRMDASDNELWTCGNECVLQFDGKIWTQHVWPDNS